VEDKLTNHLALIMLKEECYSKKKINIDHKMVSRRGTFIRWTKLKIIICKF